MNGWAWAGLYVIGSAALLAGLAQMTPPRWWRRWALRRELRELAHVSRRVRADLDAAEQAYRYRHPSTEAKAGAHLAHLTLLLVEVDESIDHHLDQLDALN